MKNALHHAILVTILLFATTLACAVPGLNDSPSVPPSPTPEGDTIHFSAPFSTELAPGTMIAGTRIVYVQAAGSVHEFSIDGLRAYRQVGDSLTWRGIMAPGIFGDYRLRLTSDFLGRLQAEGQVQLAVLNPAPVEIPPTQTPDASIHLSGIPVDYFTPEGRRIPGTTLIYVGTQNGLAEVSGTAAYPFFARDDSLLWQGQLRDNVFIRYDLQVTALDENGLGLSGTAELWAAQ